VPRTEIVVWTLFQIREKPGPSSQRVPAFFEWNARNRLIKWRLKKREKEEDGRTDERAGERTNEGSSKSYNEGRKEGKKGTRQSAAFVRFSALVLFVVVGSAGVLVPSNHWLVPKWMNKREIELPLFLFLSLLQRWSITRWPRKNIEGETEKHSTRDAARNGKEEKHRKERKERVGKIGDETNRERRKRDGS